MIGTTRLLKTRKSIYIGSFLTILFLGCTDKKFDSEKWKHNPNDQLYMLNYIVENNLLVGKTKNEVVELLDTLTIKSFHYSDNSWMYVIAIPHSVPATASPIKVMDVEFSDEKVTRTTIRE